MRAPAGQRETSQATRVGSQISSKAFSHTLVCKRRGLFSKALPLYYNGMVVADKNRVIVLSLLRALSSLDKNFPLPYAIFLLEVASNEGCSLTDVQKATGLPLPTLS